MSFQAKRELLAQVAPRYREASHTEKSIILNEFVSTTGYARKYAIRLLWNPVSLPTTPQRPRARRYGSAAQEALAVAWAAANYICGKRLVPFLPELVPTLERHGHLALTDEVREQLLSMSPATADRVLRPYRQKDQSSGVSTPLREDSTSKRTARSESLCACVDIPWGAPYPVLKKRCARLFASRFRRRFTHDDPDGSRLWAALQNASADTWAAASSTWTR